jgi:predicted phage tail component-like protein
MDTYWDGTSFESKGIVVERVHDELPEMREEMEAYPGRHGSHVSSLTLGPREIRLECRAFCGTWNEFDALMTELSEWLVTMDERELVLRTHPTQPYMAHYNSITEGDRQGGIGGFEVTFTAADPLRLGEERAFVITDTSQRSFEIGGTDRADMTIVIANASRDSNGCLTITANGKALSVPLPYESGNRVELDCVHHRAKVNGSSSGITLSSVWPDFMPGRWTMRVSSGTATLSWTQRYR